MHRCLTVREFVKLAVFVRTMSLEVVGDQVLSYRENSYFAFVHASHLNAGFHRHILGCTPRQVVSAGFHRHILGCTPRQVVYGAGENKHLEKMQTPLNIIENKVSLFTTAIAIVIGHVIYIDYD